MNSKKECNKIITYLTIILKHRKIKEERDLHLKSQIRVYLGIIKAKTTPKIGSM